MLRLMKSTSHSRWAWREFSKSLSYSSALFQQRGDKLVLGCGSNVIDHIYNVSVVPKVGEKGFFSSPFKALETKLIGGVTLNHLAWVSMSGGLLALQGDDDLGQFLRAHLNELGVRTDFIKADASYSTSQCHVFIQEDGERTILMAPASTSTITDRVVAELFDGCIQEHASMVTTEISQVPLSGVLALLDSARRANVLSVLDLDIPPSLAEKEAKLGTTAQLIECVKKADILKPAKAAAEELLAVLTDNNARCASLKETAVELVKLCNSKLIAITNGSEPCILATCDKVVEVAPPPVPNVVDTTGAGDAFLGGLIVGISKNGLPNSEEGLSNLGMIANSCGATCVQSVGGVPVRNSLETLKEYLPDVDLYRPNNSVLHKAPLSGFEASLRNDALAASTLATGLDMQSINNFVGVLEKCEGQVLMSGVGKSGLVAQRFASSLSSVGLPAHFVHAAEWVHGDLGKARSGDVIIFLSHSGNTEECVKAAYHLAARGVCTMSITGGRDSKLSKLSTFTVTYSKDNLHEPFGCVPTTSVIVQEMLCNAILMEMVTRKSIKKDDYKQNHPGGSIGRLLSN